MMINSELDRITHSYTKQCSIAGVAIRLSGHQANATFVPLAHAECLNRLLNLPGKGQKEKGKLM